LNKWGEQEIVDEMDKMVANDMLDEMEIVDELDKMVENDMLDDMEILDDEKILDMEMLGDTLVVAHAETHQVDGVQIHNLEEECCDIQAVAHKMIPMAYVEVVYSIVV
jgi:hypothetical protein